MAPKNWVPARLAAAIVTMESRTPICLGVSPRTLGISTYRREKDRHHRTKGLLRRNLGSSGWEISNHHPSMHGDLASPLKPFLFEHAEGPAAQERSRNLAATDILGVRLDRSSPQSSDLSQGLAEREVRDSISPPFPIDEEASDPPIGWFVLTLLVVLAAPDIRKFSRGTKLAPADRVRAVKHEGSVCPPLLDSPGLHRSVLRGSALALVLGQVKRDAPAAAEDPVVLFHQAGKRGPGLRGQRFGNQAGKADVRTGFSMPRMGNLRTRLLGHDTPGQLLRHRSADPDVLAASPANGR
jgi:hypothetical protein